MKVDMVKSHVYFFHGNVHIGGEINGANEGRKESEVDQRR